jgi:holo-[acyl-carrier protein] synthase
MDSGAGTDIVSVGRVARLISGRGATFLERWFTDEEIAYCAGKAQPSRHFAARLAAKEAVVKALILPWDGPVPYRSIEITHDRRGAPVVLLSGRVRESAEQQGIGAVRVSLSHCDEYAVAVAITHPAR